MTPEEKIRRGHAAERLLTDEIYREAWLSLDKALMQAWASTATVAADVRETLYHELKGLRAVKTRLETWVSDGKAAVTEIERTKQRGTGKRTAEPV